MPVPTPEGESPSQFDFPGGVKMRCPCGLKTLHCN